MSSSSSHVVGASEHNVGESSSGVTEHIQPPLSIRAERHAGLDCTEFFLHQRYFRNTMLLPRGLEVRSVLVVHTDADTASAASLIH